MIIGVALCLMSLSILYYIYDGYGRLLCWLVARVRTNNEETKSVPDEQLNITIILPVFNEEGVDDGEWGLTADPKSAMVII